MSSLNRGEELIVPSWPSLVYEDGHRWEWSSRCHSYDAADIASVGSSLPGRLGIAQGTKANNIIHVRAFVCAGLAAEKRIATSRGKAIAGTPTHHSVVAAVCEELQRPPANRDVFLTTC